MVFLATVNGSLRRNRRNKWSEREPLAAIGSSDSIPFSIRLDKKTTKNKRPQAEPTSALFFLIFLVRELAILLSPSDWNWKYHPTLANVNFVVFLNNGMCVCCLFFCSLLFNFEFWCVD